MERQAPVRVLFVCMGNICRSPMAEAIFRRHVADAGLDGHFLIDSAGTGSWHVGEPPHHGTLAVLSRRGIDPGDQRARQITRGDFDRFDYIVAMDHENLAALQRLRRDGRARVSLLLSHAPGLSVREVPDPYYSGAFDQVFDLIDAGCRGLLAHIREREGI
ncbi:MAG: low molecular weight protein-tyrosine-phosphatase [Chloroflexaceae bacterium]